MSGLEKVLSKGMRAIITTYKKKLNLFMSGKKVCNAVLLV